jgi:hypothetical protein
MVNDEKLVDALDAFRQAATPAVLEWVGNAAESAAHYAAHGGSHEDVAGFDALRELARVVAESGPCKRCGGTGEVGDQDDQRCPECLP